MSVFNVDRFHSGLEQVNSRLYISGLGVTAAQLLKPVLMKAAITQLRHEMGTIHENALFIQTERFLENLCNQDNNSDSVCNKTHEWKLSNRKSER